MPNLVPLDEIRLGKEREFDKTRYQQIQEERLNRNFRRLQEAHGELQEAHEELQKQIDVYVGNVGKVIYITPDSVSVSSGSWKTIATVNLTEGVWIVSAFAQFNSNATGRREAMFSTVQDDGSNPVRSMSRDNQVPVNGALTFCRFVDIYEITSDTTYYLNAYQNSGSALITYGRAYAVRIG